MKTRDSRGFTLIELIVTLVILALLAAITIPSFTQYIDRANAGVCRGYRENLTEEYKQYCSWEGGGWMPAKSGRFDEFLKNNGLENSFKCPSGGVYTYDEDEGAVVCSEHGGD